MADITRFNKLDERGNMYRHKYARVCINMKFGVNTKFFLGIPRAKQLGHNCIDGIYGIAVIQPL